jgi:hypothetical protein
MFQRTIVFCAALGCLPAAPALAADLKSSVVVASASLTGPEMKAAGMLADEIEKRTRIRLPVTDRWSGSGAAILIGQESALRNVSRKLADRLMPAVSGAEGYRVQVIDGVVLVAGNDARGTLFGVGALLRNLRMDRDALEVPDGLKLASAPKYPLRGHQLGYRPKTVMSPGSSVSRIWSLSIPAEIRLMSRHEAGQAGRGVADCDLVFPLVVLSQAFLLADLDVLAQ